MLTTGLNELLKLLESECVTTLLVLAAPLPVASSPAESSRFEETSTGGTGSSFSAVGTDQALIPLL